LYSIQNNILVAPTHSSHAYTKWSHWGAVPSKPCALTYNMYDIGTQYCLLLGGDEQRGKQQKQQQQVAHDALTITNTYQK
jgi:hypothetical protein